MDMNPDLTDKHALVTGGGTGIGLAIAQALAAAGAQVTISGRRAEVLDDVAPKTLGLHPMAFDVADADATRAAIAKAAKERGPIAITVANAGIAEGGKFADISDDEWRKLMAINLDGAFVTIQAALATLGASDWGRVIGLSSIAGVRGLRGAIPYTASKHGLIGLIRGLSEEYMGGNVTFNALCPGYVETAIVDRQVPVVAKRMGISEDEARAVFAKGNRHRKLLQTDEIAAAALWLCGPGSRSINGQTIQIAGGQVS